MCRSIRFTCWSADIGKRVGRERLGLVVANVALTVDPDVFVIGGGVSKAGQVLIDVITKYYHKFAKIIGDNKAKVVLAKLGNDAGIYGAARMVLK